MRIPVYQRRFCVRDSMHAVIQRIVRAAGDDRDLMVIGSRGKTLWYQYAGDLPLDEVVGLFSKRSRNTLVARVSVRRHGTTTEVCFRVLGGVAGLAAFPVAAIASLGTSAQVLRAIIWLTDDPADRIAGAILVPILLAVGVWTLRFLAKKTGREMRALWRPMEVVIGTPEQSH